jgi:hypothetical protein
MLAPGTGKTQTARLWAYGRDERPWGSAIPPASWYRFSSDRKGEHPKDHLAGYSGWMHADGYAGFEELYRSGDIREVACMAHVRTLCGRESGAGITARQADRDQAGRGQTRLRQPGGLAERPTAQHIGQKPLGQRDPLCSDPDGADASLPRSRHSGDR